MNVRQLNEFPKFIGQFFLLCLAVTFLTDCSSKTSADARNKQAAAAAVVPVKVAKIQVKNIPVQISAVGSLQPILSVAVKSQIAGKILTVHFKEGEVVGKGQLLFTLDARSFVEAVKQAQASLQQAQAAYNVAQANLANAQAQLQTAQSNVLNQQAGVSSAEGNLNSLKAESDDALSFLKKEQALFKEGIIAERDVEVAETTYKSALAKYQQGAAQVKQAQVVEKSASSSSIDQANAVIKQMHSQIDVAEAQIAQNQAAVDNAKVQLSYTQITAPVTGKTGDLKITEGNLVTANDANPMVTINSLSPIYATFSVPEKNLAEIQKYYASGNIRVTAQVDAETSRVGTLDSIDNEVDTTTGTVQLKASFENGDELLYPGRFVQIVVNVTDEPNAIVVPSQAVQISQQGQFVYVVKPDNTIEMRKITLDRTVGDDDVISEGLSKGETVVTDGQLRVSPGATVQIVTDNQPSGANNQADANSQDTPNADGKKSGGAGQ